MRFSCSRQQGIQGFDGTSNRFVDRHCSAPCTGNHGIDRQDSAFQSKRQFIVQPLFQTTASLSSRHAFDPVAKFRYRHNAEEYFVFVGDRF